MLARLDPRLLDRIWFPLGEQTKTETRAEADARRPRGRAPRREPGGVLPRRRRLPRVPRRARGSPRKRARSSTSPARRSARTTGFWRFTPGQRRGLGVSAAEPLYALGTDARTNTVVVGPRASLARTRVSARGRLFAPAGRVTAKLRYRSPAVAASVEQTASGFRLRSTSRPTASRADRRPCSTTGTSWSGPDWSRPPRPTRLALRDPRLLLRRSRRISPSRSS